MTISRPVGFNPEFNVPLVFGDDHSSPATLSSAKALPPRFFDSDRHLERAKSAHHAMIVRKDEQNYTPRSNPLIGPQNHLERTPTNNTHLSISTHLVNFPQGVEKSPVDRNLQSSPFAEDLPATGSGNIFSRKIPIYGDAKKATWPTFPSHTSSIFKKVAKIAGVLATLAVGLALVFAGFLSGSVSLAAAIGGAFMTALGVTMAVWFFLY
ncbi:MAG: hypothetical protein IT497_08690 [Ottowia sp.]|nr:hypothetical protein [Ottowia sp.]